MQQEEQTVLQLYSTGKISWRAACRHLCLIDMEELETALAEAQLPPPPPCMINDALPAQFSSFIRGKSHDA